MKHVTMADKSLLIGTEAADLLTRYAALVARLGSGDAVTLRAIGADGDEVDATFVLNSGTVLLAESSGSTVPEPDNTATVGYLRDRLASFGPMSGIPGAADTDSEHRAG
jgi:hypothetical protein